MTTWNPSEMENRAKLIFHEVIADLATRSLEDTRDTSEMDEELLAIFDDYVRTIIPELLLAVTGRRESDIRTHAHSLTGMGGTVGVPTLSVVGRELGAAAKRGDYGHCRVLAEGLNTWLGFWIGRGRAQP
jgi:HPt (histidine-containing phosphotransfer) domain-containing protein